MNPIASPAPISTTGLIIKARTQARMAGPELASSARRLLRLAERLEKILATRRRLAANAL